MATEVEGIVYDFDARSGVVAIEVHTPVGANKVVRFPTDEKSWVLGEAVVVRVERPDASAEFVEVKVPNPGTRAAEVPLPEFDEIVAAATQHIRERNQRIGILS